MSFADAAHMTKLMLFKVPISHQHTLSTVDISAAAASDIEDGTRREEDETEDVSMSDNEALSRRGFVASWGCREGVSSFFDIRGWTGGCY